MSNKSCLIILYLLFSIGNLFVIYGYNPVSSLIIGQLIITFFVFDLARSPYHFHVYQIINFYFYYSLVITHSFNRLIFVQENYVQAYLINLIHFLFLSFGYLVVKYEYGHVRIIPKQNFIYLVYALVSVVLSFMLILQSDAISYSDKIVSFEVTRNLPIYSMAINSISGYYKDLFIFLMNNPFLYSIINLIAAGIGYIGSGIKGGVLTSGVAVILSYQIFVKKIKLTQLIVYIPISAVLFVILIGSTAFRGQLGFEGFMQIDIQSMLKYVKFFLISPESNHIAYTAKIISLIDSEQTAFRYGFDYWRILFYPIKHLFSDFEFASYNQFVHILSEKKVNAGLYLGLAGELFWNFGYTFFIFSFLHGFFLKKYTNWVFSGKLFSIMTYFIMLHPVIWHLYRGSGNAFLMSLLFFVPGYILFKLSYRVVINIKYNFIRKYFFRFRVI